MTEPLRVLLVDDEPLARRRLRRMLAEERDVQVVGECGTGDEALAAVAREKPDLLLLDVQMPEGDGFEVLSGLSGQRGPLVVFVTAHDEYAVQAFEAAALDYLLKPVRRARLRTALDRACAQLELRRDSPRASPHHVAELEVPGAPTGGRLLIERGRHLDVVSVDAIDWIEAADNHVVVHIGGERHRFRRTMEQVLARLPADRFARVHRSSIVNLARVGQVHPWFHGNYLLVLADGTKLTTGRQYRDALLARLHAFG
ncbi:MAG: LytR/AlgR family response regulator transcription factor [Gemmatimonadales bacterium]